MSSSSESAGAPDDNVEALLSQLQAQLKGTAGGADWLKEAAAQPGLVNVFEIAAASAASASAATAAAASVAATAAAAPAEAAPAAAAPSASEPATPSPAAATAAEAAASLSS